MRRQRSAVVFLTFAGVLGLFSSLQHRNVLPILYINLTASIPRGIYKVVPSSQSLRVGEIVIFAPPPHVRQDPTLSRWLKSYPMIKLVGAVSSDTVCKNENTLQIYRQSKRLTLEVHDKRRAIWKPEALCIKLRKDFFFPVGIHQRSFDARYFGPVGIDSVVGRAVPMVTF